MSGALHSRGRGHLACGRAGTRLARAAGTARSLAATLFQQSVSSRRLAFVEGEASPPAPNSLLRPAEDSHAPVVATSLLLVRSTSLEAVHTTAHDSRLGTTTAAPTDAVTAARLPGRCSSPASPTDRSARPLATIPSAASTKAAVSAPWPDCRCWANAIARRDVSRARSGRSLCRRSARQLRAGENTNAIVRAPRAGRSLLGECASPRATQASRGRLLLPAGASREATAGNGLIRPALVDLRRRASHPRRADH